jgi:CopG family nickel-responsive transcriptional regulator
MPKRPREYVSRFSVSLPRGLLSDLDAMIRRKGYRNRSLAVADMVRDGLVEYRQRQGEHEIAGTITLLYDHHKRDLTKALTAIQHDHHQHILATLHVHLDHDNCLEVIAVRGRAALVQKVADRLIATKGVKHGKLTVSSTGKDLIG